MSVTHDNRSVPTSPSAEPAPKSAEPAPKGAEPAPKSAEPQPSRDALRNALAGLLLAVGALGFFGWNEHRSVDRERALSAVLGSAHEVGDGPIDQALEGELVIARGPLLGSGPLRDGKIPFETRALRLRRTVQMYQWEATRTSREETGPDGQTRTVESESYTRVWASEPIDSDGFEVKANRNPEFPLESVVFDAEAPRVGPYRVPAELIGAIDAWEPIPAEDLVAGRASVGRPVYAKGEYYFIGDDPSQPEIGDLRVAHQIVPEGLEASAIGQQRGHALGAFAFRNESIEPALLAGTHDARALYESGPSSSRPLVWVGRGGGALLACLAFFLMLGILSTHREKQSVLGDLARAGALLTSVVLGVSSSLIVMGAIWLAQGYFSGGAILALGLAALGLGMKQRLGAGRARRPKTAAS